MQFLLFRRYATMIDLLNPLKIVFKSDNALFFDEETRKFYRCLVISGNENSVDILLSDEFKKRVVNTDSLYKLPGRFYRFHYMSFMLNSANIPSEHVRIFLPEFTSFSAKLSPTNFESVLPKSIRLKLPSKTRRDTKTA